VVDLEYLGRESCMPLFVVLREGLELDEALRGRHARGHPPGALGRATCPARCSRWPPIPRTLSGKKMELPVKKLLLGRRPRRACRRTATPWPTPTAWRGSSGSGAAGARGALSAARGAWR
jgi:acetoacetyl-CoA synthetase